MLFYQMSKLLQVLAEKLMKTLKHGSLLEKLVVFSKWMIFFSRNERRFATFGRKVDENAEIC